MAPSTRFLSGAMLVCSPLAFEGAIMISENEGAEASLFEPKFATANDTA